MVHTLGHGETRGLRRRASPCGLEPSRIDRPSRYPAASRSIEILLNEEEASAQHRTGQVGDLNLDVGQLLLGRTKC